MPPTRTQHPNSRLEDCQRKRRYGSKKEAKSRARRIPGETVVYQCAYCGGWHFANRRKPARTTPPEATASA